MTASLRRGGRRWRAAIVPWPLFAVLAVQAGLSLRLVWSNTAYTDEALYIWAGHQEWAHWLHGVNIAPLSFPTYFSGAPATSTTDERSGGSRCRPGRRLADRKDHSDGRPPHAMRVW